MAINIKFSALPDGDVAIELGARYGDSEKPEWKAAINLAVHAVSGLMSRPHDCPRITHCQLKITTPSGQKLTRKLGGAA